MWQILQKKKRINNLEDSCYKNCPATLNSWEEGMALFWVSLWEVMNGGITSVSKNTNSAQPWQRKQVAEIEFSAILKSFKASFAGGTPLNPIFFHMIAYTRIVQPQVRRTPPPHACKQLINSYSPKKLQISRYDLISLTWRFLDLL